MTDRIENLSYDKRWMRDGLEAVSNTAGIILCIHVDMTDAQSVIAAYRHQGIRITYTHLAAKLCADLLAKNSDYHRFVIGNKKLIPSKVDIGLSVAANQPIAPILVIQEANLKSLSAICEEVTTRVPQVKAEFSLAVTQWQKWGWLVPFSILRRWILRLIAGGLKSRQKAGGSFLITNLSEVDLFVPLLLGGVSALGMGRVSERVTAQDGQMVIRPMMTLTYSVDHSVFDGYSAQQFLVDLKTAFETCKNKIDFHTVSK